jgi:hypothetical protein
MWALNWSVEKLELLPHALCHSPFVECLWSWCWTLNVLGWLKPLLSSGKLLCWAPVFIIIIFCYLLKPSKYIVLHTFELLGLIIPFLIQECCICLCPYEDGVELRELPCNHHFHCSCIDKWLHINATCPLCKFDIIKSNRDIEEV